MITTLKNIFGTRKIIFNMSLSDFKSRFAGSYFGILWAVVQPLMTILIFWFVFQIGFKAQPKSNVPFILWLCAGMVPWNFFSDCLINSTSSFTSYSFIVKKLVFDIKILPLVKIISSFFLNLAFNGLLIIIYVIYGKFNIIYLFSMLYYNIALVALLIGLSYLLATFNVFFRDTTQIVGIILQFGIWITPIMWDIGVLPKQYTWIIMANPLYYIVNGYRAALIDNVWFWQFPYQTVYFWILSITLIVLGSLFFKKMKTHFADVL